MTLSAGAEGARGGLRSVTRGTFIMLLGTLGFVAEGFLSRVILYRGLAADEFGLFTFAFALGAVLSAFGALGIPSAVARNLPYSQSDDERRAIVRTSLLVTILSASLIAFGLLGAGLALGFLFHHPLEGVTLDLFSVAVGLSIVSGTVASIFQGYEDVRPNAIFVQVVNPALFIAFLLIALYALPEGASFLGALVGYALAGALTILGLYLYARRRLPRLLPPGPRAGGVARRLLGFALPLFAVGTLGALSNNGDTIVLGFFRGGAIGAYTADLPLARLLQVGLGSLAYIFLPVAARYVRDRNDEAVRITYATATKWVSVTSLPLFLVLFFLPGRSLGFVYGLANTPAAVPLQILVAGAFVSTLVGPASATQVSYGETRLLLYNTAAAAAADIGLSLVLIPALGLPGAAIAWAVGAALQPVLSMVELAALHGVHPFRRHYLIPLVVTALPLGAVFALAPFTPPIWTLPVLAVGIVLLFVLVVLFSGSLDDGDRLLLEAVEALLNRRLRLVRRVGAWCLRLRRTGRVGG
ncbi:MAG TPA: flippase [Thermoplasmata archaeon]|nr:flippase [Thermoplasmata archaeon]